MFTDFRKLFSSYFTNGVFVTKGVNNISVKPKNGLNLYVTRGAFNINGVFGYLETDETVVVPSVSTKQFVRVCLKLDDTINSRDVSIEVKTNASTMPELVRTSDIHELCLAEMILEPNQSSITSTHITDTRLNKELCGAVTSAIEGIDTTALYNQIKSDLSDFKVNEKSEFLKWFDGIKNILNENVAGNLLNEINAIKSNEQKSNLLINADFESSIINQLSYKTTIGQAKRQYPIDMWSTYGLIDVTNEIGYLTIKNNESNKQSFTQFLTNRLVHGKKYTITYKIDGKVVSETFTSGSEFIGKNCFYKPKDSLPERIGIDVQGNKTIKLYFVKLEEGDVYTGKPPYDWWHEFSICQTELKQISTTLAGYGWNGGVYTLCPQIINMVRQPSIILEKGGLDGKIYISNDQSGTAEFLSYDASVSANGTIGALRWYNAGAWDGYKVCGYINTEKIWLDARAY